MELQKIQSLVEFTEITPEKFTHNFLGFGIHKSSCEVEIYRKGDKVFVLFVDTGHGTSVTNACELLVQEIYDRYLIGKYKREDILFAETYKRDKKDLHRGGIMGAIDIIHVEWSDNTVIGVDWEFMGELVTPRLK